MLDVRKELSNDLTVVYDGNPSKLINTLNFLKNTKITISKIKTSVEKIIFDTNYALNQNINTMLDGQCTAVYNRTIPAFFNYNELLTLLPKVEQHESYSLLYHDGDQIDDNSVIVVDLTSNERPLVKTEIVRSGSCAVRLSVGYCFSEINKEVFYLNYVSSVEVLPSFVIKVISYTRPIEVKLEACYGTAHTSLESILEYEGMIDSYIADIEPLTSVPDWTYIKPNIKLSSFNTFNKGYDIDRMFEELNNKLLKLEEDKAYFKVVEGIMWDASYLDTCHKMLPKV